jgi:hypothetical protein
MASKLATLWLIDYLTTPSQLNMLHSRDNRVNKLAGYELEVEGSITRKSQFSLRHRVQADSGFRPTSYRRVPKVISTELKWPERKAYHSPPSSVEAQNAHPIRLHGVMLRRGSKFTALNRRVLPNDEMRWLSGNDRSLFYG